MSQPQVERSFPAYYLEHRERYTTGRVTKIEGRPIWVLDNLGGWSVHSILSSRAIARIQDQLRTTRVTHLVGPDNIHPTTSGSAPPSSAPTPTRRAGYRISARKESNWEVPAIERIN